MDWKTMLSYISGSVDEELLLRNEYLVAENRVLRNQLRGRLRLTDGERRSLAELGKRLGKQALDEIASIVNPDTILGWHRRLVAKKFDSSEPPRVSRRLQLLRGWSHDKTKQVFTGDERARSADGFRPAGSARISVVSDLIDCVED